MIPKNPRTKIVFFPVRKIQSKLLKIVEVAHHHFNRKESLLITTLDQGALKFLDELLWKTPEESFLPHVIADEPCQELIVITNQRKNLNEASYIFNLSPTPLLFGNPKIIYELEDFTSPNKHLLSQKRFEA